MGQGTVPVNCHSISVASLKSQSKSKTEAADSGGGGGARKNSDSPGTPPAPLHTPRDAQLPRHAGPTPTHTPGESVLHNFTLALGSQVTHRLNPMSTESC